MPHFDPLLLARFQFGLTVSFHVVFPAITVGLGMGRRVGLSGVAWAIA